MNKMLFSLPLTLAVLLAPLPSQAQFGPSKIASAHAAVRSAAVVRGGKGVLTVTLAVKPQYHVNANKPNDPAYIPTVFMPKPVPGIVFGAVHYPAPKLVKVSYSPKPLLVYTGQATMTVPFTVTKLPVPAKDAVWLGVVSRLRRQSCYPPETADVQAAVTVK